jgi:hypothetical protein
MGELRRVEVKRFVCGCGSCDHLMVETDGLTAGGLALGFMEALVGRPLQEGEVFAVSIRKATSIADLLTGHPERQVDG